VSVAIHADLASVDPEDAVAEAANLIELMSDKDDGAAGAGDIAHFAEAFFLEIDVADGEDFIDEENFRFEMSGNGESEADIHAGGVVLDWSVDEFFELGEGDDFVEFGGDFAARHAENGSGEKSVFASGELGMKASADFKERADAAADFSESGSGASDAGEKLEKSGLAGAVASDEAEDFAFVNFERNIAESPEEFSFRAAKNGKRRANKTVESVAEAGIGDDGAIIALREGLGVDDGGQLPRPGVSQRA
jgi:hypothetical protein